MEKLCRCPHCRFARHEISSEEYAWYLKGTIEAYNRIFHTIDHGDLPNLSMENLKSEISKLMNDDSESLESLLRSDRSPEKIEEAWLFPKIFNLGD